MNYIKLLVIHFTPYLKLVLFLLLQKADVQDRRNPEEEDEGGRGGPLRHLGRFSVGDLGRDPARVQAEGQRVSSGQEPRLV